MARATRSTTQNQEKESSSTTTTLTVPASPPRVKLGSKKRKRQAQQDDEEPTTKQPKSDNAEIKEEHDGVESRKEEEVAPSMPSKRPSMPNAGDTPITSDDAQKILEILDAIDDQGLLDRVFPLPDDSSIQHRSLRSLLKGESGPSNLSLLRSAVQNLTPISHSRSKPSGPASRQRQFCDTALSLLDQASFHNVAIPPGVESVLPEVHSDDDDVANIQYSSPRRQNRYALKQRLPTGDWWTSLSNDISDPDTIKGLSMGHAQLAVSLPTPSAPTSISVSSSSSKPSASSSTSVVPSLGTYSYLKTLPPKASPSTRCKVTTGSFLDYGVNASFAPSYCQDGSEVGREQLGELLWRREQRMVERVESIRQSKGDEKVVEVAVPDPEMVQASGTKGNADIEQTLCDFLPPEDIENIRGALASLELENAVQELLDRNARALVRLQGLQEARLLKEATTVEANSEEWDTAQAIVDSLELLASLRPRSLKDGPDVSPFVPPPALLRVLHKTIPVNPSPGWYGTLPSTSKTAAHDNTTIKVKPGAAATAPVATTATPAAATPATAPGTSYYPYGTYPTTTAAQQYRPPAAASYTFKPQTPGSYYSNPYAGQPQQTTQPATQTYPQQPVTYINGTGQMQYGSWYNYAPQYATGVAGGSNSGRGTPTQTATIPTATSYGSFFATSAQTSSQSTRTPAVANTVTSKGYQGQQASQAAWPSSTTNGHATQATASSGQAAAGQPTLPAHLRSSAITQPSTTPGTPSPGPPAQPLVPGTYQQQTPYYTAYQQPSAAPSAR